MNNIENKCGGNFSSLKQMLFGTWRSTDDCSDAVATTEWVSRRIRDYNIDSWTVVYDKLKTTETSLNTVYAQDNVKIELPDAIIARLAPGVEVKVYLTLWGAEICCLQGIIVDQARAILSTATFDAINVFLLSFDIRIDEKCAFITAKNQKSDENISSNCVLQKIEIKN